jgi:hypothetical protein
MKKKVYTFKCPVCQKLYRAEDPGEPCCTGPSEMRDDHPMTVMHLLRVDKVDVHPVFAEKRAEGPLIIPDQQAEPEVPRQLFIVK